MYEQLGIRLHIAPGFNEVRSMRGIAIHIDEQPGLCRRTRQSIPAAIAAGWRSIRRSPGACSMPTTCCEMREESREKVDTSMSGRGRLRSVTWSERPKAARYGRQRSAQTV
ncbi:hypothetical protein D3C80_1753380 [compost metagenome]